MSKVLVVEDNELNLKLFCDLLITKSHSVISISSGNEVFDTVKRENPDLVLIDVQLSDSVSGIDATRILKKNEKTKHIPIVIITAFAMQSDELIIRESGCDAYLFKPIFIDDFFAALSRWI